MSIQYLEKNKVLNLYTKNTLYQMKVSDINVLQHVYYGKKIENADMSYYIHDIDRGFSGNPYESRKNRGCSLDLLPQEFSSCGVGDFRINSISIEGADGSRSVDFRYVSHEIRTGKYTIPQLPAVRENEDSVMTLVIQLKDNVTGIMLELLYGVYEEKDIITRTARIINKGENIIYLEKVSSMLMDFIYGEYDLIHFYGRHNMERIVEREALTHDTRVIGSKRGMTSHHHNPFVILCDKDTTEYYGDCYGFMLMYSGNHKIEIEKDQAGSTRIIVGIHDEGFRWKLKKDQCFYTPETILSYSENGLNELSQKYHRIIRENVIHPKYLTMKRPVLINNWEATYFDFDSEKIISLAKEAKELGIEMLVLDDGWFGIRNDDNTGLGDWFVNEEKLQGGLGKLSDEIHKIGMKFGLWFEPEMINEESELFQKHPDWVLCDPNRKPMMSRNQMVLDMSRKDVQNYLFDSMSKILDSASIDYIKWDFNRSVANVYSNVVERDSQGEVSHRFVLGTYTLLERLTNKYKNLFIEGCAGGGGRFDAGMLYYTPQIWCSDDTDPIARLEIQKGTSYGYPISAMGSHVSASPNHQTGRVTSLKTRGIVAMSGTFGYELDLTKLTKEEKEEIKQQIKDFDRYYWLIQAGDYYRLSSAENESYFSAWEFVSKDKSEVLVNIVVTKVKANPDFPYVKLRGLDENAEYVLEGTKNIYSGAALMYAGYAFDCIYGNDPSEQLHFVRT